MMCGRAYTIKALAERWGCCEQTIRTMISTGELHCFNLLSLVRISAAEVARIEGRGDRPQAGWQRGLERVREDQARQ